MRDIKESDWKVFKPLREIALERFCERVLDEVARINLDTGTSKHQRYLDDIRPGNARGSRDGELR